MRRAITKTITAKSKPTTTPNATDLIRIGTPVGGASVTLHSNEEMPQPGQLPIIPQTVLLKVLLIPSPPLVTLVARCLRRELTRLRPVSPCRTVLTESSWSAFANY